MEAATVEELGFDPDANDKTRDLLYQWLELFTPNEVRYDLAEWVMDLSLRDPRLTALAATNPAVTMGEPGAWTTTDAQHAAIESWHGGGEDAKQAWLDTFVLEAVQG